MTALLLIKLGAATAVSLLLLALGRHISRGNP
jgi:hypothetical protein